MIKTLDNFLSKEQCDFFIQCYEDTANEKFTVTDLSYSFNGINLIKSGIDYEKIEPRLKASYYMDRLRVQRISEDFSVNGNFHMHLNNTSFTVFLNDNYTGGALEFESGELFKPKVGQLIKFHDIDAHRVRPVSRGTRYTLVGLLDSNNLNGIIGYPREKTFI